MKGSVFRGENPEGRDLKQGRTHSFTVFSISAALGDPQEEGNNLRNGGVVGTAEMADG